jgi:hypothetical protein
MLGPRKGGRAIYLISKKTFTNLVYLGGRACFWPPVTQNRKLRTLAQGVMVVAAFNLYFVNIA